MYNIFAIPRNHWKMIESYGIKQFQMSINKRRKKVREKNIEKNEKNKEKSYK